MAFDAERRRKTCMHEAAHAVIFAIGNRYPYLVEVAPVGAVNWEHTTERGLVMAGLHGVCCANNPLNSFQLCWSDDSWCYTVDRHALEKAWRGVGEPGIEKYITVWRREIRAHICGLMAGPVVDSIIDGQLSEHADERADWLEPVWEKNDDLTIVAGMCDALPFRREYESLLNLTLHTLREPKIWAAVLRLADALEKSGKIEYDELDAYLPKPRRNWPALQRKTKTK